MLDANKIEHERQYHKVSFPKSVSTTFVSKCRPPHDQGTFHKMMGYSFKNTRNGKKHIKNIKMAKFETPGITVFPVKP